MSMLLCMIKTHYTCGSLVRPSSKWSSMYAEVLLDFSNTLDKVLQSPSQDRILYIYYYQQSDFFFAPVSDLGTLGPLGRFFNTEWLKNASQWPEMWGSCWQLMLYPEVILFYQKEEEGGGYWLILGLLFRIWTKMKSNGHHSTRNGFCNP